MVTLIKLRVSRPKKVRSRKRVKRKRGRERRRAGRPICLLCIVVVVIVAVVKGVTRAGKSSKKLAVSVGGWARGAIKKTWIITAETQTTPLVRHVTAYVVMVAVVVVVVVP